MYLSRRLVGPIVDDSSVLVCNNLDCKCDFKFDRFICQHTDQPSVMPKRAIDLQLAFPLWEACQCYNLLFLVELGPIYSKLSLYLFPDSYL